MQRDFNVGRDDSYLAQHRAILEGDGSRLCSLAGGNTVMRLISAAELAARSGAWISS
jgi:hypothetical protein